MSAVDSFLKHAFPYLLASIIVPTVFTYGPMLEGNLFPVLDHMKIETVVIFDDHIEFSGYVTKERDCAFVKMEWFLGQPSQYVLAPTDLTKPPAVRNIGRFGFGPWRSLLTESQLYNNSFALAYHRCHPFWDTVTKIYP